MSTWEASTYANLESVSRHTGLQDTSSLSRRVETFNFRSITPARLPHCAGLELISTAISAISMFELISILPFSGWKHGPLLFHCPRLTSQGASKDFRRNCLFQWLHWIYHVYIYYYLLIFISHFCASHTDKYQNLPFGEGVLESWSEVLHWVCQCRVLQGCTSQVLHCPLRGTFFA